jgi:hypothetical protein
MISKYICTFLELGSYAPEELITGRVFVRQNLVEDVSNKQGTDIYCLMSDVGPVIDYH